MDLKVVLGVLVIAVLVALLIVTYMKKSKEDFTDIPMIVGRHVYVTVQRGAKASIISIRGKGQEPLHHVDDIYNVETYSRYHLDLEKNNVILGIDVVPSHDSAPWEDAKLEILNDLQQIVYSAGLRMP